MNSKVLAGATAVPSRFTGRPSGHGRLLILPAGFRSRPAQPRLPPASLPVYTGTVTAGASLVPRRRGAEFRACEAGKASGVHFLQLLQGRKRRSERARPIESRRRHTAPPWTPMHVRRSHAAGPGHAHDVAAAAPCASSGLCSGLGAPWRQRPSSRPCGTATTTGWLLAEYGRALETAAGARRHFAVAGCRKSRADPYVTRRASSARRRTPVAREWAGRRDVGASAREFRHWPRQRQTVFTQQQR